jgi:hypothetical protein
MNPSENDFYPPWHNTTLYSGKVLTGYIFPGSSDVFSGPGVFQTLVYNGKKGWREWVPVDPVCLLRIKLK